MYFNAELLYITPDPSLLHRWQFSTQGADIGFGVFLKDKKGEWKKANQMQEVVPSQRYNAHLVPEDGSLTCERPGVCKWASTSSVRFIIYAKTI